MRRRRLTSTIAAAFSLGVLHCLSCCCFLRAMGVSAAAAAAAAAPVSSDETATNAANALRIRDRDSNGNLYHREKTSFTSNNNLKKRRQRRAQVVLEELGSASFNIPRGNSNVDFRRFLSNDQFAGRIYEMQGVLKQPLKGQSVIGTLKRCPVGSRKCRAKNTGDRKLRLFSTQTTDVVMNLTVDVLFVAGGGGGNVNVSDVGLNLVSRQIQKVNTLVVTIFGEKFDSGDGDDDNTTTIDDDESGED